MWQPLVSGDQLSKGSRLRKTIHEGDIQSETIFRVTILLANSFMTEAIEHNGRQIAEEYRYAIPYSIKSILYHGFEIWV